MNIFVTSFSRGKVDGFMNCETFKSWSWLLSNELTSHFDGSIWLVIGLWNAFNHYGTEIQDGAGKIPNMFVHIDIMPSCSFRKFSTAHPWCQSPVPPHSNGTFWSVTVAGRIFFKPISNYLRHVTCWKCSLKEHWKGRMWLLDNSAQIGCSVCRLLPRHQGISRKKNTNQHISSQNHG